MVNFNEVIENLHATRAISDFAYNELQKIVITSEEKSPDANVERNRQMLLQRSIEGLKKYGVTTERVDLNLSQWLQHAIEEALDLANYLQAIKSNLENDSQSIITLERIGDLSQAIITKENGEKNG